MVTTLIIPDLMLPYSALKPPDNISAASRELKLKFVSEPLERASVIFKPSTNTPMPVPPRMESSVVICSCTSFVLVWKIVPGCKLSKLLKLSKGISSTSAISISRLLDETSKAIGGLFATIITSFSISIDVLLN